MYVCIFNKWRNFLPQSCTNPKCLQGIASLFSKLILIAGTFIWVANLLSALSFFRRFSGRNHFSMATITTIRFDSLFYIWRHAIWHLVFLIVFILSLYIIVFILSCLYMLLLSYLCLRFFYIVLCCFNYLYLPCYCYLYLLHAIYFYSFFSCYFYFYFIICLLFLYFVFILFCA